MKNYYKINNYTVPKWVFNVATWFVFKKHWYRGNITFCAGAK